MKKLIRLSQELNLGLRETIGALRALAIQEYASPEIITRCRRHGIFIPDAVPGTERTLQPWLNSWWNDPKFHLDNRLRGGRDFDQLISLFPQFAGIPNFRQYLETEHDVSILPLNLSLGMEEGVWYLLPVLDYHSAVDPYAIKHKDAAIIREISGHRAYVATRKQDYGTYLLTLTVPWADDPTRSTFLCPIGCTYCYRGIETRNRRSLRITETDETMSATKIREQTAALAQLWEPDVHDVLISGGEPLLLPNRIWREDIINVLNKACPHLHSFRICTGCLGLGLASRFDDELLGMLSQLNDQGIAMGINAHIAHPQHFTPEMVEAAWHIRQCGGRVMTQVPIIDGVNFFNRDLPRTVATLRRIAELSYYLLGEPVYKFIVDMQGSVSLLSAIRVYRSLFDRHQAVSNIIRPTSFELFVEAPVGNVNLSYHTLLAMTMTVDRKLGVVTYVIPHPAGGYAVWHEKIIAGINDDERLLRQAITEPPIT